MSNLEILTLLELAEGSPKDRAGPRAGAVAAATGSLVRWFGTIGQRSLLLLVFLAVWETTPRLGLIDVTFLPPFSEVIAAGWQLAQSGELYDDVGASLLRALSGFLIAIVLFVPLGVLTGWYARLGDFLNQIIEIAATRRRWLCCRCLSCCSGLESSRRSPWWFIAAPGRCCSIRSRPCARSIRCWSSQRGRWARHRASCSGR